jgi:hypothetical protein
MRKAVLSISGNAYNQQETWRSTQRLVRLNQNMTLHLKKNNSLPSNPLLTR